MRYFTTMCAASVIALAGCSVNSGSSGSSLPNAGNNSAVNYRHVNWVPINSAARAPRPVFRLLYSFTGSPDGALPEAGLTELNGQLYGTTYEGGLGTGTQDCCGTVFKIDPSSGKETVLHIFGPAPDGTFPSGDLLKVGDTLYGTTSGGGSSPGPFGEGCCGTVFSITPSGKERVLYSFRGNSNGPPPDGAGPQAGLINVGGTLYGTTCCDGLIGNGTVFSISPGGKEKILYSFGYPPDGARPNGDLIDVNGTFYGTTPMGGVTYAGCVLGGGTVFAITRSGSERVLHRFECAEGGFSPGRALVALNGTLYGTTGGGGGYSNGNCEIGCGTVFQISTSGHERVLHRFGALNDGAGPVGALIAVNGTLYGTTTRGGTYCGNYGCGTVFAITTSGNERIIHSFDAADGDGPWGRLLNVNGTLYGTTYNGGASACNGGCGTVFSITP